MNKVVLKVELEDDKIKKKAMEAVSSLSWVESVSMDMKEQKLSLFGDIDPAVVMEKLRELCHTYILYVGPAKEEKKKAKNNTNYQNQWLVDIQMRQPHYYYSSLDQNPKLCGCFCPYGVGGHIFFLPLILVLLNIYRRTRLSKR